MQVRECQLQVGLDTYLVVPALQCCCAPSCIRYLMGYNQYLGIKQCRYWVPMATAACIAQCRVSTNAVQGLNKAGQVTRQLLPYNARQNLQRAGRASRPRAPRRQWLQLSPKVQGLASGWLRANERLQRNGLLLSCASSAVLPSNSILACDLNSCCHANFVFCFYFLFAVRVE